MAPITESLQKGRVLNRRPGGSSRKRGSVRPGPCGLPGWRASTTSTAARSSERPASGRQTEGA
jgi:hypothetical protein